MNGKLAELGIESVTKQPLLTGFPRIVLANAKRRRQAEIRRGRDDDDLLSTGVRGYSLLYHVLKRIRLNGGHQIASMLSLEMELVFITKRIKGKESPYPAIFTCSHFQYTVLS